MPDTNGQEHCVGDQFFRRYRQLLDAEDAAFDELEHAYEDGDRAHFELDLAAWQGAIQRRHSYLERSGVAAAPSLPLPPKMASPLGSTGSLRSS